MAKDNTLSKEAQLTGKHRTKKDTVKEALKEHVPHREQLEVLELFGKIDYDNDYDYKKARNRK